MTLFAILALFTAGVAAGGLTTIAGLGGGILLIAGLSLFWPPVVVLGMTAPALFIGNLSRVAVLYREVDWGTARAFAVAAVPAAFAASLLAAGLHTGLLRGAIAVLLLVFVAQELRHGEGLGVAPKAPRWLAPAAGAFTGVVSGLTGGAGFVAAPLLDRLGLSPARLVATMAACMALVHLAKGLGFGLGATLTPALLPAAAVLAGGVVVGNGLGARLIKRMPRALFRRCLLAALVLAALQLLVSAATAP